jgi:hypothetical protein|tara:strand:+ start:770 stop:1105 length:336 start_codon:yes stop_codon:yes gene_type:complete
MSTQGAGGQRAGSGRPKGSLGEKTKAVQAKLDLIGCDPIEALANISMDNSNTPELRFQANKELAQYIAPKRRAIEMDALVDGGLNVNVVQFSNQDEEDKDGAQQLSYENKT